MTERELTLLKSFRSLLEQGGEDMAQGMCSGADKCEGIGCYECPLLNTESLKELRDIVDTVIVWEV